MPITLTPPVQIGDLQNRITISELEIVSFALNLEPGHVSQGHATLSIMLRDPVSGWQTNVVYRDETALAFWGQLDAAVSGGFIAAIWAKLQADGKLPPGTAVADIPQLAAAQAAAAAIAAAPAPAPDTLASPISAPSTTP